MSKISIKNVYKIFGPDPLSVLSEARSGISKEDFMNKTGQVIGIRDVSLEIEVGETRSKMTLVFQPIS